MIFGYNFVAPLMKLRNIKNCFTLRLRKHGFFNNDTSDGRKCISLSLFHHLFPLDDMYSDSLMYRKIKVKKDSATVNQKRR